MRPFSGWRRGLCRPVAHPLDDASDTVTRAAQPASDDPLRGRARPATGSCAAASGSAFAGRVDRRRPLVEPARARGRSAPVGATRDGRHSAPRRSWRSLTRSSPTGPQDPRHQSARRRPGRRPRRLELTRQGARLHLDARPGVLRPWPARATAATGRCRPDRAPTIVAIDPGRRSDPGRAGRRSARRQAAPPRRPVEDPDS